MCVGTYHAGRLDKISVRDGKNPGGPRREAHVSKEIVMTDTDPIIISRWLKDEEKPEAWQPAGKKGARVVVTVSSMETTQQGIITLRGSIEPLV